MKINQLHLSFFYNEYSYFSHSEPLLGLPILLLWANKNCLDHDEGQFWHFQKSSRRVTSDFWCSCSSWHASLE